MKITRQRKQFLYFLLFATPAIIGFFLFTIYPLFRSLFLSFTDKLLTEVEFNFVGFKNYIKALTVDNYFFPSIGVTLIFTALSVPLSNIISLGFAMLLNRKTKGLATFRIIFYLPSLVPAVAMSLMFVQMFDPASGFLNEFLKMLGFKNPPIWLGDPFWSLPTLVFMTLWGFGGRMIIYLAALQGVSSEMYEAADLDGASAVEKFFRITLPMISPILLYNFLMGIIGGLQVFTESFIATGGTNNSTRFIVLYIYQMAYNSPYMIGYASAMAWLLFVLICALVGSFFLLLRKKIYYEN